MPDAFSLTPEQEAAVMREASCGAAVLAMVLEVVRSSPTLRDVIATHENRIRSRYYATPE